MNFIRLTDYYVGTTMLVNASQITAIVDYRKIGGLASHTDVRTSDGCVWKVRETEGEIITLMFSQSEHSTNVLK